MSFFFLRKAKAVLNFGDDNIIIKFLTDIEMRSFFNVLKFGNKKSPLRFLERSFDSNIN